MSFFGRRKGRDVPVNEGVRVIPVFAPDPHGAAIFSDVVNANLGHLGSRPILSGPKFHGWVADPQQKMTGASGMTGTGRPVVAPTDTLDRNASSDGPDAIQALFTGRAAERRL